MGRKLLTAEQQKAFRAKKVDISKLYQNKGHEMAIRGMNLVQAHSDKREQEAKAGTDLDLIKMNLNSIPKMVESFEKEKLMHYWDISQAIESSAVWIRAHIALTIQNKWGESSVEEFANIKNLDKRTIYRYITLAKAFPKIDPLLPPTFHMTALQLCGAKDQEKAVKLVELAREKKRENPAYTVRDFIAEVKGKEANQKQANDEIEILLNRALGLAKKLSEVNLKGHLDLVNQLKKIINDI